MEEFHSPDPEETVRKMAEIKAKEVFERINEQDVMVIGSDTIVFFKSKILGKPKDVEEARKFLERVAKQAK